MYTCKVEGKRPLVMQLPKEGVLRYMSTVKLQLEVLSYVLSKAPDTQALTLFGSREQRVNLASSIIVIGSQVEESYALASK